MLFIRYAVWAAAAGAFIPVMAVLNARLGRTLGEPLHAVVLLFGVGLLVSLGASLLLTGRLPSWGALAGASPINLTGGFIVAFYVLSVTLLAPRFGIGNAILFVMIAQIFMSAAIDHYGLFGAATRPVSLLRMGGLAIMLAGLAIAQLAPSRPV